MLKGLALRAGCGRLGNDDNDTEEGIFGQDVGVIGMLKFF